MRRAGTVVLVLAGWCAAPSLGVTSPEGLDWRQMVRDAAAIVYGEVVNVTAQQMPNRKLTVTVAQVKVEGVDKGTRVAPDSVLTVRTLGGRVGNARMIAAGLPTYVSGERVYLFLAPDRGGVYQALGGAAGKLEIARDPDTQQDYVVETAGVSSYSAGQTQSGRFGELADPATGRIWLSRLRHQVSTALCGDVEGRPNQDAP